MKRNKKILLTLLVLTIVLTILFAIFVIINKNDVTSTVDLYDKATLKDFDIKMEKLEYNNGTSHIKLNINNITKNSVKVNDIRIIFKDSNGFELSNIIVSYSDEIKPNENATINTYVDGDLTEAVIVDYILLGGASNE